MAWTRALEVATEAARAAGALLREDFERPEGARGHGDKADADVVAERLVRARLAEAFPDFGYLGEETGRSAPAPGQPVWLVDPNDGTRDYVLGRRGSAVSIGLAHEGRAVLGVVFAFAHPGPEGDLFAWAEGCGPLRRNGAPVEARLASVLDASSVVLLSSGADSAADANLQCVAPARYAAVPSIAHRLALVAAGDADAAASLYAPCAWDYGGGHALLRAAGATLVDEAGREISYGPDGGSKVARAFAGAPAVAAALAAAPWERLAHAPGARRARTLRLEKGRTVTDAGLLSRAQGCLLGQVAGDSLGSLVEFRSAAEIASRGEGPRELRDGGTWSTLAGQPTDDSEMALALGRTIVARGGFDEASVLQGYRDWLASEPFDVGHTTRSALTGHARPESEANGSLMRASPLGVLAHRLPAEGAADLARRDSALTHPSPVCGDAVAAYVVAIAHAVRHGDGPRAAYQAALRWAQEAPAHETVGDALRAAERRAPVCDAQSIGWVLVALQASFHALLTAATLEEGVVAIVRGGGDTDTNGAIAGALLGAVHGREAIPAQWRRMVLSCRPHAERAAHPRPMTYWPVDVPELAERLLLLG